MNVALIDVDLPRNGNFKFPTLTLMKISAYCKARGKVGVYVLTNYWSTLADDLKRMYWLRDNGYCPYG